MSKFLYNKVRLETPLSLSLYINSLNVENQRGKEYEKILVLLLSGAILCACSPKEIIHLLQYSKAVKQSQVSSVLLVNEKVYASTLDSLKNAQRAKQIYTHFMILMETA